MKKIVIILLFFSFHLSSLGQEKDYKNLWNYVEQMELQLLPTSASKLVDSIYKIAKRDKNDPQTIKSLLYKGKFILSLKEDAKLSVVQEFKQAINESEGVQKRILQSILADIYWDYYGRNRYRFFKRTSTKENPDPDDFRTWDLRSMITEIDRLYQLSLEDKKLLQQTDIKEFESILILNKDSKNYRPTLFDILAHRAIGFYKYEDGYIVESASRSDLHDPAFFSDIRKFQKLKLSSKVANSYIIKALSIYQDLAEFHLNSGNTDALGILDIERLRLVNQYHGSKKKESLFLSALKVASKTYRNPSISGFFKYEIADIYSDQADKYLIQKKEEFKLKNRDALNICNEVINSAPNSLVSERAQNLKRIIEQKTLEINNEHSVPIGQASRLLIQYKNLNQLNLSIYRTTHQEYERFRRFTIDEKVAFLAQKKKFKSWNSKLKNINDYLRHSTEIIVPKLEGGVYLITASEDQNLTNKSTFGISKIQSTNISFVENDGVIGHSFQFLDRKTGAPLKGALVRVHSRNSKKKLDRTFTTNKQGFINFKLDNNYYNVDLTVRNKKDIAHFEGFYFYKTYYDEDDDEIDDEDEEFFIEPFVFTDRSIYRPGQKLYFKSIVIRKKGNKSELFTDEYVDVTLYNPNDDEVKVLNLKLNEYGSVSGEFDIPNNGLTGEYYINVEEDFEHDSDFYDNVDYDFRIRDFKINVEEYKRPTFEVVFNPLKETYQLNDSILVKGNAASLSGAKVSNAEVTYSVKRKVNYPWWYYDYSYRNSSEETLMNGKTTTDDEGNFEIKFKAIPDKNADKENKPTFSYEISADITDINGETRSDKTTVRIGYHLLEATVQVDDFINRNDPGGNVNITVNNLNGQASEAIGKIHIYKLKAPKVPLRERPWDAPDYQVIPEEEFRELFPHDPYKNNEDKPVNWKMGKNVWSTEFDTKESLRYTFETSSNWQNGKYKVVLETKDRYGNSVTAEKIFSIYNPKDKKVADQNIFFYQTDKPIYKVGETAKITIGTAAEDITVTAITEKNEKIEKIKTYRLKNGKKTFSVKINKGDENGFALKFHFVAYNSLYTDIQIIPVLQASKNLNIIANVFRDKSEPGKKETWSFSLKDDLENKIAGELLASMYDSSLDQFKSHSWSFSPNRFSTYRAYNTIDGRNSFKNNTFRLSNPYQRIYSNYRTVLHTKLDEFGFSINSNYYTKKRYLKKLQASREAQRKEYDKIITGVVNDNSDNTGLPGASVNILGTEYGTDTDFDGNFSIKVKEDDVLVISYLGYEQTEVSVKDKKELTITMTEAANALDEVVVMAMGRKQESAKLKASLSFGYSDNMENKLSTSIAMDVNSFVAGNTAGVSIVSAKGGNDKVIIRGLTSVSEQTQPLYIIDGVPVDENQFRTLEKEDIQNVQVLNDGDATALYGNLGANGVVLITTKAGQKKLDQELGKVKARTNFNETAFFFPQLRTNEKGEVSFSFEMPESLTRWKLQLLAHTKDLKYGEKTLQTITQKKLMVVPNTPRFLREGDEIVISSKINNLTDQALNGFIKLDLINTYSEKPINQELDNSNPTQNFQIAAKGNAVVSWRIKIPEGLDVVTYRVVAKAGEFSDGQQDILPVLSNRTLVTETMPIWVRSNQTKTFELEKLIKNTSTTLTNHKLTFEMTSNPAWYALQSLPYLMEYPYECAEQTFSRFYANTIASHVANSSPKIKNVFDTWKNSDALISNLEKNEELKSLVIQETPWLRDSQSETEQKKRIGLLFDLERMKNEQEKSWSKLAGMQMSNGGFPWFKGSRYANRYITQHIVSGIGHLRKLGIKEMTPDQRTIIRRAHTYLDNELLEDYQDLLKLDKQKKKNDSTDDFLSKKHVGHSHIQYLYGRSFYDSLSVSNVKEARDYYMTQSKKYWKDFNLYAKAQIALIHWRDGNEVLAKRIMRSLEENSIRSEEMGMYWKENSAGFNFYESPIETQALMIEAFSEIVKKEELVEDLKVWLLKNKQTNRWKTTKATTEAVYALLMNGKSWLETHETVSVTIGNKILDPQKEDLSVEAGTGYYKTSWKGKDIVPEMGKVTVSTKNEATSWGGLYWQYFENLDKITSAETPLKLKKRLFKKVNTDSGKELIAINKESKVKVGDLITVRIELRVDRNMEFLHMKDMRASGVEPVNVLSKYKWQDGLGYYESTKDASTNFFFEWVSKGVYVFEYDVRVNNAGDFSNGITTIQSMYAPEFSSHSEGIRIKIE